MKLYFLKEDSLETLKGNIKTNLKKYSNSTNEWIKEFLHDDSPFIEYKMDVNDFKLDISSSRPEETDIENIKRVYTNLNVLTEHQATEERIWSGLAHGVFWNYMQYRWSFSKNKPTELDISGKFFLGRSKRRSLIINSISRLWWIGRLTYDKNRKNPFELTEFLRQDLATRALYLFSSNYSSNPMVVRALLFAMISIEKHGTKISRNFFLEATKYLNILGGTYILDYFTEEELTEKIIKRFK